MKCKVEGCGRDAQYKLAQLCQKHYFRIRRNGKIETLLDAKRRELGYTRQYRVTFPGGKGYQRLYEPEHPLRDTQGYVAEHRLVVFARYEWNLPDCELCGVPLDWATCHIDHIDNDPSNNKPDNLRPLCRVCNTTRDYPEQHTIRGNHAITYNGVTMTATEWARRENINVCGASIIRRLAQGMTVEDALFSEKRTHNGKQPVPPQRKTIAKHERSNSVSATIDGVKLTAMEWSRHDGCTVTDGAIRNRIKAGWPDYDAVFAPPRFKRQTN
jgi:hypothetical protein